MHAIPRREPAPKRAVLAVATLLLTTLVGSGAALAGDVVPPPVPEPPVLEPVEQQVCETTGGVALCRHSHQAEAYATTSGGSAPAVPVGCAGDGQTGNRLQAVYVRASDRADRYASVVPTIRQAMDVANGVFTRSSGGRRALRVVTTGGCATLVDRVTVRPGQLASFADTVAAVRAAGRSRIDRKYVLFVDGAGYCGVGEMFAHEGASPYNPNNDGNMFAAASSRCWAGTVVAHEIVHLLGGVQPGAPHSTRAGHCRDRHDVVCYPDGSGATMTTRCGTGHATLLDCGRDDYFSVAPPAGSYLARHWNTASNSFLVGGGAPKPAPPSAPTSVTSSRRGDDVTVRWGTPVQARSGLTAFDVVDLADSGAVLTTVSGSARAAVVRLTPWRTYRIAVVARNAVGRSAPAGGQPHMVGRPPAAPLALTAVPAPSGVQLGWTAPARATAYVVLRDGRPVGRVSGTTWTDRSALATGTLYRYTVRAGNAWGWSPPSPTASAVGF